MCVVSAAAGKYRSMSKDVGDSSRFIIEPKFEPNEYVWLQGFRKSRSITLIYGLLCTVSLGVVYVIGAWYPRFRAEWSMQKCSHLQLCDFVLLKHGSGQYSVCPVQRLPCHNFTYFEFRKRRYVFSERTGCFELIRHTLEKTFYELHCLKGGLSTKRADTIRELYGANEIVVDRASVSSMLLAKVSHPFYIFQVFSSLVWFNQGYNSYAVIILVMSVCSIAWEIFSAKRNEANLCELAKLEASVEVLRDGEPTTIDARSLVVGDVVVLNSTEGSALVCDMAVITGELVVDESTLTGESIPIVKQPMPAADHPTTIFDSEKLKQYALYGGSRVLQIREHHAKEAVAIVTATGFSSAKGELFRSILFPKKIRFRFEQDSYRFLLMLSAVAVGAFINRCIDGVRAGNSLFDVMLTSLDLITIAVPPALPLVLTAGVGFSMDRLRQLKIFCIDPQRVSLAGRIDTMCWDKTGTLTSDDVIFYAVQRARKGKFEKFLKEFVFESQHLSIELCMAACHGINQVEGEMVGHAVDLAMYAATGYVLESTGVSQCLSDTESESHSSESTLIQNAPVAARLFHPREQSPPITVLKRFDFDNHLQRSCVILQVELSSGIKTHALCAKGSPEAIRAVCAESSIPINFDTVFQKYSSEGYYILGCAARVLKDEGELSGKRDDLESNLEFLGFVLLQNPVKSETCSVLHTLQRANIENIIITGDNALTAIHVAREIGLAGHRVYLIDVNGDEELVCHKVGLEPAYFPFDDLPQRLLDTSSYGRTLAVRGVALDRIVARYDDDLVNWIMEHTLIFARIKPHQKTWIVERLMEHSGRFVGMCGDGTNDCGALKAAHIGVALSTAEASIVAPLTSTNREIADVIKVISEGRCALATSFAAFKFMTLYPICQLMVAATLNHLGSTMSNNQYLFDDLVLVLVLGMLMLMTQPARQLKKERPTDSLFSPTILASIIGQVILAFTAFTTVYITLHRQPWFCSTSEAALWNSLPKTYAFSPGLVYPYDDSKMCFNVDPVADFNNGLMVRSTENTVFWTFGHFMYLVVAVAFSVGAGFRRPFWTNRPYLACIVLYASLLTLLLLFGVDLPIVTKIFQLVPFTPPLEYRWLVFAIVSVYAILAIGVWEPLVVSRLVRRFVLLQVDNEKRLLRRKLDETILDSDPLLGPHRSLLHNQSGCALAENKPSPSLARKFGVKTSFALPVSPQPILSPPNHEFESWDYSISPRSSNSPLPTYTKDV